MTDEVASSAYQGRTRLGRYELFTELASGGMATIHLGRVVGAGRFARTVAIKRLHQQYARDANFARMFLDEAELVARIRHPNVVPTIDMIEQDSNLFIVMELIEGVTLKHLVQVADRNGERVPWSVALSVLDGVLRGLHAAHEAKNEKGDPLGLVHRDVSPDNVLVGVDGLARVFDFGIAKALGQAHSTQDGHIKGKVAYMTPEQLLGKGIDRRADVFSASIVLWEALTSHCLFSRPDVGRSMHRVLHLEVPPPSALAPHLPDKLDAVVLRGLERDPEKRWSTALEMAQALAEVGAPAPHSEVGEWVRDLASERLSSLESAVAKMEQTPPLKDEPPPERDVDVAAGEHIRAAEDPGTGVTPLAVTSDGVMPSSATPLAGNKARYIALGFAVVAVIALVSFLGGLLGRGSDESLTGAQAGPTLPVTTAPSSSEDPAAEGGGTPSGTPPEPTAAPSVTATAVASASADVDAGAATAVASTRPRVIQPATRTGTGSSGTQPKKGGLYTIE